MEGTIRKRGQLTTFIDGFLIVIQVTYGMSMLKVWLLDPMNVPYYLDVTFITILIYNLRFKSKYLLLSQKGLYLPKFFLFICLFDVFQSLFFNTLAFTFSRGVFMLNLYFFIEYLVSLYYEKPSNIDRLALLTKPYELYSAYNLIAICLCAVLILMGVLSSTDNPMTVNSLIKGNLENGNGNMYYFPGYLSLALSSFRLLSYLDIPVLTGLSHEPHVIWWILGPTFFLFLDRFLEKKGASLFFIFIFLIISLLATSFTALVVFVSVVLLECVYSFFISKRNSSFLIIFIISISTFTIILLKNDFILDAMTLLLDEKMNDNSAETSAGYSVSTWSYFASPGSLFGLGNVTDLGWGYQLKGANIGLITFLLDLVLFVVLYIKVFKLCISKNIHIHYIGMACLYFLFHSLKLGTQVFQYPYYAYIIVLITITSNSKTFVESKNK